MNEKRTCLECGDMLAGRADKKFCDDQCRSHYNNRRNSDATSGMRNVNNILRRNRRILVALVSDAGKRKVARMQLAGRGFDFRYHTHTHTTQKGSTYRLCYDYGYLPVDGDCFLVVRWQIAS